MRQRKDVIWSILMAASLTFAIPVPAAAWEDVPQPENRAQVVEGVEIPQDTQAQDTPAEGTDARQGSADEGADGSPSAPSERADMPADPAAEGVDLLQSASSETVCLDESWEWASNSEVHSGEAVLYHAGGSPDAPGRRNITVCVNAGHGTASGSDYQTLSHPDGTAKVTGGTNAEGAIYSTAISSGMAFTDGTPEASATLMTAMALKDKLLQDGYDVLMIRESDDVQLDNIARTVIANNIADIHVAIHFDSTQSDKGVYFCSVPDIASYRQMEPVASHWPEHMALGQALIQGMSANGFWLFGDGTLPMDLTQTSYSTIPSVDIEIGDAASDHSPEACERYAQGLKDGIDLYFESGG